MNYHFGSKQALLDSVLGRRSEVLNEERMQRLEACIEKATPGPPQLDEIIDAFTHPLLDRSERGGPGWKAYFGLIAQMNNSTELGGVIMTKYFDPVVRCSSTRCAARCPTATRATSTGATTSCPAR